MESSNEIEEKSQVGEGRACWSLGNAHSAMGETESAYHYASRSFSRLGEFSFKTCVMFDLLDILTLQERLEIGWGKPLLRSNGSAIKCISKNKAPCIFDLLAMADYFSTRMMSGQSKRTRENSWIC